MSLLGSVGSKIINVVRCGNSFWSTSAILPNTSWLCSTMMRPITTTPVLLAEPMKKKKRVDPGILRKRQERKERRLGRFIRQLLKNAKQLKPIEELGVPEVITDKPRERNRRLPTLSTEEVEYRWMLEKQMSKFKWEQTSREMRVIESYLKCQEVALEELKKESEELYLSALQFDSNYLPLKSTGPVDTPPNKNWLVPEGDYADISRKWEKP